MSNCCLKYTDWLSDLILNKDNIIFSPDLFRLIQPFDPKYSGIWRPLITNTKRIDSSEYLLPYNVNPQASGNNEYLSALLGYDKFIKISTPQFRNWNVTGFEPVVDIGMNYENALYYWRKGNRNLTAPSIQSKKVSNFSTQTINVIRNKLNDESKVTEPTLLSAKGSIPRIDSSSSIEKIEVIPRAKIFGLKATNDQLLSMFNANIGDGIQWTFSGDSELFKYLSSSEYIALDYTIFTKKNIQGETKPRTGQYSVRVLVFGENDLDPPVVVSDESKDVNLNENTTPYARGSIVIEDQDLSQEIYAYVKSVSIVGSLEGSRSSVEDIKKMLVFNKSTLRNSTTTKQTVDWIFNGGTENFSYLKQGQGLSLIYALYIYDNLGKYIEHTKTITIIGKNEPPGIGVYSVDDSSGGIYDLNDPKTLQGTLSVSDIDYGDSIRASVIGVSLDYSKHGAGDNPQQQFLSMLSVSSANGKLTWNFNPDTSFLQYLSGGQFVQANYAIKGTDGAGGNGYGVVSILIIGKNEDVDTSLSDIDTEILLPPKVLADPPSSIANVRYEQSFTISDLNKNDFVNISILYCEYSHINVEDKDIPKNLDIKRMLYFVPDDPKNNSNQTGTYRLIFESAPESFRYLNTTNKKAILSYRVIITDSYGSYKIKNIKFTIIGSEDTVDPDNNTKDTSIKFEDYVWGWYRYYDIGRKNDTRHIHGVDFYFGDVDTFLFYGEPEFLIPQTGTISLPSGYTYQSGQLIIKNNTNDLITSKNLDNFFPNAYEKSGVLALLKTHPYIDLVTHNLTDVDSLNYTRDNYGRILPFVSGLSAKEYNNIGKQKFVSNTEDIAYRLADKYGLRMLAKTSVPCKAISKFTSCIGPNIGIQQINKIYHKKNTTDFSFLDVGVVVGNIKYDKQLAKLADNSPPIKLNSELMKSSPIIDYGPCGVSRDFLLDQTPYNNYTGYNISNYYFNIVDYRLNNELFHQEYVINNISGNYSGINKHDSAIRRLDDDGIDYEYTDVNSNLLLDLHGHGGIKDRCLNIVYASGTEISNIYYDLNYSYIVGNVFFDPLYPVENIENIETKKEYIILNYYANPNSEGEIGNINIEYLRSPTKPSCRSFIEEKAEDIIHTTPNSFRFDFRNNYYISRAYAPSVTTYYIPPSGFYYANHYVEDKIKIGVHLEDHPDPRTPLTKTHDLAIINPLEDETTDFTNLFTLSYNGTFNFKYNLSHLPAGRVYLYSVAPSGSFTLSLLAKGFEATDSITTTGNPSGIDSTVYLEFNPKIHNQARIEVLMGNDCDNWTTRLSHEKLDYLKLPLISKLDVDTKIGFFHPNSGWLDASGVDPKYLYKTPFAPYTPAPLDIHQNNLEKHKLVRPDHYFWYDAEKMYSEEYLDGVNLIIDTSGMVKPLVDIIDKSQYVAFLDPSENFYYVTPDFYVFDYNEEESPIRQSIRMSYLHMDYSYWYPFNDFIYSLVDQRDKRKIAIYSLSDNKRCFSYFDDQLYNSETVVLANHETINVQNQIASINQAIDNINNLITIANNQINNFSQQISFISNNSTISAQDKAREILKLQGIINSLSIYINTLNNNISLLQNRLADLTSKSNSFFSAQIIASSGNGDSLILTLASPVPDYLSGGGFIKKDINVDKHQSLLLYRSNVTRNDPEIKVGKWGNIIAGKDVSEYNNSILRQNKWNQSAIFFNFNPQNNIIVSSGYYFPYSYATDRYNVTGSKIYKVIPNEYNEKYNFEDYGLISSVSGRLPTYIYAGPYQGNVFLSRVPKRQLIQLPSGEHYLQCRIPPSGISKYPYHNLRGGDFIKFEKISEYQKNIACFNYSTQYIVSNDTYTLRKDRFFPSIDGITKISCSGDPDLDTHDNIFILNTINPKFNIDVPCLGKAVIKHNNLPVPAPENHVKPKTPIYYELDYRYENIFPYLTLVLPYHGIVGEFTNNDHLTVYDKFLGNIYGNFFTYVNDPGATDREGLIRTTRCSFYNHNDAHNISNYSNVVGDESPMEKARNPDSPAGLSSLLIEQTSNDDLLDNVINSLTLQRNTLVNTINILNHNLSDTSKNDIEKNQILQNIQQINIQINIINQTINNLNGQKSNPPPPTYVNWDKIPTQVNVGFPENRYKAKNPFIDMHIFSKSGSNDPRFQPTFFAGKPSPSGYVYFEGLVEPPLSDFYGNMITRYNPYKKWIDIPKNAKWGLMTKSGKVFWQNAVYSVQKTFETSCDLNASKCDLQKPTEKNVCGSARLLNGSYEIFQILKMNPTLFESKDIVLPGQCANISYCCNTMSTIESSNLNIFTALPSMDGINQSDCYQNQNDYIKKCSESYYPQNSVSYINLFCYDQYCPQSSGSGGYPIGSLSGTNYGLANKQLGGTTVVPISGRADITGESLVMFRLNPIDIKTFIIPNVTKKITFVDSTEPLHTPNTRIDDTLFNHNNNVNNIDIPFSGVGYLSIESGNRNSKWLQKYCSYIDLIEPGVNYYFKHINEDNSNFIDLRANSSGLIWKNETLYRDHVPHSGCFYGFMGEYDVLCNLNNNPFYKAQLLIDGRMSEFPLKNLSEPKDPGIKALCQQLKDLKNDCVEPGPLYETHILDGNYTYIIKVSLLYENDRLLTEYNMTLGDRSHVVKIEHTTNTWDHLLYYTDDSDCESYESTPDKNTLDVNCYDAKKTFELIDYKHPFKICKGNRCPDGWIYCSDEIVSYKRVYGKTLIFPNPPKCPPNGIVGSNQEWKVVNKSYKLGRSKESCDQWTLEVAEPSQFPHSDNPSNYFYATFDYSSWLCFPEPDYKTCYKYAPDNYISFTINVYHNLIEIILPDIGGASWPSETKRKNRFYVSRDSSNSLFPIVKTYMKNPNISINSLYKIYNNQTNYLGEIIFTDD